MFASQSTIFASIAAARDSAISSSNHSRRERDAAPSDGDAYSPRAAGRGSVLESTKRELRGGTRPGRRTLECLAQSGGRGVAGRGVAVAAGRVDGRHRAAVDRSAERQRDVLADGVGLARLLDDPQRPEVDGRGSERGEIGQSEAVGVGHSGLEVLGRRASRDRRRSAKGRIISERGAGPLGRRVARISRSNATGIGAIGRSGGRGCAPMAGLRRARHPGPRRSASSARNAPR